MPSVFIPPRPCRAGVANPRVLKLLLGVLAQFVEARHVALFHRGLVRHGDEPAEFRHRAAILYLQNQILPARIINNDGLLGRFVDVLLFVPNKFGRHKHAVRMGVDRQPQSGHYGERQAGETQKGIQGWMANPEKDFHKPEFVAVLRITSDKNDPWHHYAHIWVSRLSHARPALSIATAFSQRFS